MPRVLVVDDTASIRLLIRTNLEINGFEVDEAVDGHECLERLWGEEPLPDIVTIDVVMPQLDGISTVLALRAHSRTVSLPIIMVSTRAQTFEIKRAMDAGVNIYVTKPFDPSRLIEEVRSLL